jgi:HEAT repeat protein
VNNIIQIISNNFSSQDDQIRQAAAIALGSISIGNTSYFLEIVFNMIKNAGAHDKYMFLSTLREIIMNKPECLKNYIPNLLPLYLSQSSSDEEPIRNIVSESIGKLFIHHFDQISGSLEKALQDTNMKTVATCARSFKFSAHNN